ncbi:DUF6443 domain-containing protein [Flavobacterium dauae]|uniref:DUF6443 domain-containing protein n=1 Tax=Flavobacterium dauae TaxID=1563479 RepID=UPI00101B39D1|nr:DUF6443 domain-containing protein [Flavobacterium dauae]WLD24301.1 DUF6443 domain-containing protein [Flavobacterium dauae]
MKTRNLFTVLLLCAGVLGFAQSPSQNYTVETIYKEGRNPSGSYTPNAGDFVTVTYYDGLGRPIQQLQKNASPVDNKNIVTHIEYDKNIGQTRQYLPFTTTGGNADYVSGAKQATLDYYTTYNEYTENPYSETRYEAAPNGRVTEEGAPGYDWSISVFEGYGIPRDERNTIRYDYSLNTATEVKKFDVTSNWNATRELYTNTIAQNGNYPANSLKKTITKNENWKAADGKNNTIEEFTGADGKAVLKRTYNAGVAHDTYYVYDFYGNLAYVIPPLANGSVTTTNLNNLCYQYLYDDKNRLVEKKLPQKGWEFIVYDKADRIVMTGPANNPFSTSATPGWIVTKYDNMGRTLYTGYYSGHTVTSANRKAIKTSIYAQADNNEAKTTANTTINGVTTRYTNTKFPTAINLLTVNYYDNYEFPNAPSSFPAVQGVTPVQVVKGLATGSWTRVITTATERKADVSYTLYNSKYQPLRTYTTNYLGGYIQTDNVLTFRGIPTKTITTQKKDAAATVLTVTNNYTYDNRERLKTHTQQINGGTAKLIAENTYDDLGVLIAKKVGNTIAVPLQKVDYKYNLRGWLTDINSAQFDMENDLFGFTINYNQRGGNLNNKVLYNGNINSVSSRTKTDNVLRGYSYYYDDLNRLVQAKNLHYENGGWNIGINEDDSYGEALSYDKNGNILTVSRSGELVSGQPVEIDDLTYTYTANQLQTVTDATNNTAGFKDGNKTGADYTYDTFGNLKTDKNKGITNIVYNHLNLPVEITFATGKINYTYDAVGTKVKKVVTPTGGASQTTDYLFGFEYENGVLSTFPHAEGYVKNNAGQYIYHYIYKDHLGNNRLVYADLDGNGTINPATEIVEESNYYPFGLKHEGYNELQGNGYKYKLLNREYEDSFAFNVTETDYRQYDATLGRFNVMDVLSEMAPDFTPYRYGFNNPVFFSDASGLFESYGAAQSWIDTWGLSNASISYNQYKNVYEIENDGVSFYQRGEDIISSMYSMESGITIDINKGDASGSSRSSGNGDRGNWYNLFYNEGVYNFLYNNPAVTGYDSGDYGAYIPDASSFSIGGSVSGFIFSANFSVGIAVTNTDAALVLAGDFGFGLNPEMPGAALGVGFGAHDLYEDATDVLKELGGEDIGWYANAAFWGVSHSQTATNNWIPNNEGGVQSTIITIGPGLGAGTTRSHAASFKFSNGINNIKNLYNSWNF